MVLQDTMENNQDVSMLPGRLCLFLEIRVMPWQASICEGSLDIAFFL
jgi:hypothetical protein